MKKRLLITGYGGFVAGSVAWQADSSWEVHALSHTRASEQRDDFRYWQGDLCNTALLHKTFGEIRPSAVIHAAARADIDYCQSHQEEAARINTGVTQELAQLCNDSGAKLIFCSTDSLFDGQAGRYREDTEPSPINFYAETKVHAEQAVQQYAANAVTARLSLVLGLPVLGTGNSFLAKMSTALKSGKNVCFPENEIRTPIDVITLGQALLELAANDFTGIIHLAGSTRLNRYDMGCRIAERLGYSTDLITGTNSNVMQGRAPRPNDVSLNNEKAGAILDTPMKTLREGLDQVLKAKEKQDNEQP